MIRCTPVCGPGPALYWVSGLPEGCWTVNEIVVGRPGGTGAAGVKPPSANTFAGATRGTDTPELPELPHATTASAAVATAAAVGTREWFMPALLIRWLDRRSRR